MNYSFLVVTVFLFLLNVDFTFGHSCEVTGVECCKNKNERIRCPYENKCGNNVCYPYMNMTASEEGSEKYPCICTGDYALHPNGSCVHYTQCGCDPLQGYKEVKPTPNNCTVVCQCISQTMYNRTQCQCVDADKMIGCPEIEKHCGKPKPTATECKNETIACICKHYKDCNNNCIPEHQCIP